MMKTIVKKSFNIPFINKLYWSYWIRYNYPAMPFEISKIQKNIKQDFDFLVFFSNEPGSSTGSLLYGISITNSIPTLKLITISADDVFGGGPTQRVIDDFLKYGLTEVFKVTGYPKLLFDVDSLSVGKKDPETYLNFLEQYHKDIYKKIVRESDQIFSFDSSAFNLTERVGRTSV